MPIIQSAAKRARQTKRRTAQNSVVKRRLKEAERNLEAALNLSNKKDLAGLFSVFQSNLDTAVKKHLIHKNKAARAKQRYSALIKQAGATPVKAQPKTTKPKSKSGSKK